MEEEKLDFTKVTKKFDNTYEIEGPEFSIIDEKRDLYIQANAHKKIEPLYPENIQGLIVRKGKIPSTRRLWKRTSSYERSGFFNLHTPHFNTKFTYYFFLSFIMWGFFQPFFGGVHREYVHCNYEEVNRMYDKLCTRTLPMSKIWSRPS